MIMGAGKTTVISPMLALVLGDGTRMIMQVVPPALLQFAKDVARASFSAVIHKPVYTFVFDRFSVVSPALYHKLRSACDSRAVVLTTPTAIKSLALKFIDLMLKTDSQL